MKSFFSGAIIKVIIATALAALLVNDLGSVVSSNYLLAERAEQIAKTSLITYDLTGSKRQAYDKALSSSVDVGATLTKFEIKPETIEVAIEIPPHQTWVLHRIESLNTLLTARAAHILPRYQ